MKLAKNLILLFIFCCLLSARPGDSATDPPILAASQIAYPPFCIVDSEARAGSFSIELLRAALAAMEREVIFRTGNWQEVRGWLGRGEVQVLPLMARTPEPEAVFDFPFRYMSLHDTIVVRSDTPDIQDLENLRGRSLTVLKGDDAEEFLRRIDRGIDIHTTPTFAQALEELSARRRDAVIIPRLVALRLIQETGLTNLRIVPKSFATLRQDFCFAVAEGDRDMSARLNEGPALIMADGTFRKLHAKWFAALELPSNRRILVGGDSDYPPFEYIDKNGNPAGFNVDLTRAIARSLDQDIEIRLGPWAGVVKDLEDGTIDALQGMFYSLERDRKFDFSPVHTVNHCVSVIRAGHGPPPATLEDLAGKKIVVQRSDIMHDFVMENGSAGQVSTTKSPGDALREFAAGKHDCALLSRLIALYLIDKNGWDNLEVTRRPLLSLRYCYAVPDGHVDNLATISEGLQVLEQSGEYQRIYEKWLGVYDRSMFSIDTALSYIGFVVALFLLLIIGSLLWSRALKQQVARRTEALQRSEEMYRRIAENISDVVWSMDLDLKTNYVSPSVERLFGESVEAHLQRTLEEKLPPESRAILHAVLSQELEKEKDPHCDKSRSRMIEMQHFRADGSLIWVSINCSFVRDNHGNVLGIQGVVRDISKRKLAEKEIKQSHDLMRYAIEHTNSAVAVYDKDLRYIYVSQRYLDQFKISDSNVIGKRTCDVIPNMPQKWRNVQEKALHGESFRADQDPFPRPDGTIEWMRWECRPWYLSDNAIGGIIVYIEVITDRLKAEKALRESEEYQRTMIAASPLAIISFTPDGRIRTWNAAAEQLFGWKAQEVVGRVLPTIPIKQWGAFAEYRNRVLDGESFSDIETERRRRDGMQIQVSISLAPLRGQEGRVDAILAVIEDITERKNDEKEKETLQKQLIQVQKMKSIGRLAGGVAHDFNNMLGVILGYTELALDDADPDDSIYPKLVQIHEAGKRSADLTRQLLAFSRKQTIAPKTLDLNETIEGMLKMLRRLIGEDISLSWHPGVAIWPVCMDPTQLDQILVNLCVNARDAIVNVGKIVIETDIKTFDDAYCAAHAGFVSGDFVQLSLSDDGYGMEKETIEHIFEPFFTTKGNGKGTGLGLATVYGITKQNNGFINVYSEPGQGTTFKIYLPRQEAVEDQQQRADLSPFNEKGSETILLVEDDETVLRMTAMMLERLGYRVLTTTRPDEAIGLAREHGAEIHLLMTDVVMPEMNGQELSAKIHADLPGLKTLFMSGYTANVVAHHGILEEGIDLIQKPFFLKELSGKLRAVLDSVENLSPI